MTDPITETRLDELQNGHARFLTAITQANLGVTPPGQWRLITGDTYFATCIGPVCADQDQHQMLDEGPDVEGQYECCPGPVIETDHEPTAAWLVELLNTFPEMAAEVRRLRADIADRIKAARKALERRDESVDRWIARTSDLEAENAELRARLAAKEA